MGCTATNCCEACIAKAAEKSPVLADFDPLELAYGIAHELEYTADNQIAKNTAMSNLAEDPSYYHRLDLVEQTLLVDWSIRKNFPTKRVIDFQGLRIHVEHDAGSLRPWTDPSGEKGHTKMVYPYGYIARTEGDDDEQVDVFVGPNDDSDRVFVIHQMRKPPKPVRGRWAQYDEQKVMVGFESPRDAKAAYLMHYNDRRYFGSMTETNIDSFKRMFVQKSLGELVCAWQDTNALLSGDDSDFEKGLLSQLKKLWRKIKQKFGGVSDEEVRTIKPTKTWVRQSSEQCKTGVCARLDGKEIAIDDQFEAINGMFVDGPPAHGNCMCTLVFDMNKSLPSTQVDTQSLESVQQLLSAFPGMDDATLMALSRAIWGSGYDYNGSPRAQAAAELLGWLLDQQDLLSSGSPVVKHKYIKREGVPGDDRYYYTADKKGPGSSQEGTAEAVAAGDFQKSRAAIEDALYNKGPYFQQGSIQGRSSDDVRLSDLSGKAAGVHNWDGSIEIDADVAASAQKFAKAFSDNPTKVKSEMADYVKLSSKLRKLDRKRAALERKEVTPYKKKLLNKEIKPSEYLEHKSRILGAVESEISSIVDGPLANHPGLEHLRNSDAMSTLVHEVYHGYGPLLKQSYVSTGAVVEEISTEVLARRDMRDGFGVPEEWGTKKRGSYQLWIDTMISAIRKEYGASEKKAWSILEDACDRLKKGSEGGDSSESLATHFVMLFPPTGDEVKDKPRRSLTDRHPITGDWYDMSHREWNLRKALDEALKVWNRNDPS